jgi:hypothetical protein
MSVMDDIAAVAERWTTRELADRLASGTPDDDAFVLRVVAARLVQHASRSGDLAHLLSDLANTVESIAQAVRAVNERENLDGPDDPAGSAVEFLECAAGNLNALHNQV